MITELQADQTSRSTKPHTPGRLRIIPPGRHGMRSYREYDLLAESQHPACQYEVVARAEPPGLPANAMSPEEQKANAEHLAACWNAFADLPECKEPEMAVKRAIEALKEAHEYMTYRARMDMNSNPRTKEIEKVLALFGITQLTGGGWSG